MAKRYFELESKFWEIWREGTKVLTRTGKIGASGHTKVKDAGSTAAAKRLHDELVEQKTGEGYAEANAKATSAANAATPSRFPFPTQVPALAAPAAKAPLAKQLAAFEQAVDIGPLDWTDKLAKGRSAADLAAGSKLVNTRPLWDQIQARIQLVSELAKRLVAHAKDRSVSDTLTRVVSDHPCDSIRYAVGTAIVGAGAPAKALAEITRWIDEPAVYGHWNWQTGARAVLLSRDTAFETLEPHLANATYAERVLGALQEHAGEIDPRFFKAAIRWLPDGPGTPSSQSFFERHGEHPEARAELVRAADQFAAKKTEPEWGYFYIMLQELKIPETLPALLKIATRASKTGDWRFTSPLSAIEELRDPAALPELRVLAEKCKGKAKSAVVAVITALEKAAPGSAVPKPSKTAKATKATKATGGSASPLANRLIDAGLSAERAESVVGHVRNRIDLAPKRMAKPALGTTRFGGEPDLPAKTTWPHIDVAAKDLPNLRYYAEGTLPAPDKKGRYHIPLSFIAQLDLADLAAHDEDGLLPKTGMLWFFARQEVIVGEERELQRMAASVIYARKPGTLVRTPFPDTLAAREHYKPAKVTIKHARTLPPPSVEPVWELALITSEASAYEAAVTKEKNFGTTHACLGWANAAYYRGIPGAKEQLLLAVGTESASGFEWGDASRIFFCISSSALAKQDFAKAYCIHDEC